MRPPTVFDRPIWKDLQGYARLNDRRDNLDLLQLPDDLREQAAAVRCPCISCGAEIRVFRARLKSGRSRVAGQIEERRLFYAATCPTEVNSGCSRSRQAKEHKQFVRALLGKQREPAPAITVRVLDASGAVLYAMTSEVREPFEVALPFGAASIAFVP